MASPPACPDPSLLRLFVRGLVPPELRTTLGRHLEGCPACAATLDGLHTADALTPEPSAISQVDPSAAGPPSTSRRGSRSLRPKASPASIPPPF